MKLPWNYRLFEDFSYLEQVSDGETRHKAVSRIETFLLKGKQRTRPIELVVQALPKLDMDVIRTAFGITREILRICLNVTDG